MEVSFPSRVPPTLHLLLRAPAPATAPAGIPASVRTRLARWLGRGDAVSVPALLPRDHAAALAGWTAPVPWAVLCGRTLDDATDPDRHWIWLEPVQMAAGMNSIRMAPLATPLPDHQLATLASLVAQHLAEDGWTVRVTAGRLLAGAPQAIDARCQPPELAAQGELREHLPAGAGAGPLRRLLTECQMLLHQAAEEGRWQADANALWPWGNEARTGATPGAAASAVFSDDPLTGALAPPASGAAVLRLTSLLQQAAPGSLGHGPLVLEAPVDAGGLDLLLEAADAAMHRRFLAHLELTCWTGTQAPAATHAATFNRRADWRFWRTPLDPWKSADE